MVDARFDDQRMKLSEEESSVPVRFNGSMNVEVFSGSRRYCRKKWRQCAFDQTLHCIIRRTKKVEPWREIEARK